MEIFLDKVVHWHKFYAWALSRADPRVSGWLFMDGYTPTIVLSLLYIVVTAIGPRFMENREPFAMKRLLVVYNFVLVAMNFHICKELLTASWKLNYSYSCQKVNYSDDPDEVRIAKALWWFYFSKLVEMLDTIFFILRKKNNQISFLHVYHHATMFPIWWIGVKWVAGGQSFFGAMINSFIHVVMYSYYGISALGPQYQKYLWWKRYLTKMQLTYPLFIHVVMYSYYGISALGPQYQKYLWWKRYLAKMQLTQFVIGMIYGVQHLYYDCDYPLWMVYTSMAYGVTIIVLFGNFYYRAYLVPKSSKIQFCAGITHAAYSIYITCDFPTWMQWALVFYAFTILCFFLNFYFHAYLKRKSQGADKKHKKGQQKTTANGRIEHTKIEHTKVEHTKVEHTKNGYTKVASKTSNLKSNGLYDKID